MRIEIWSDVVCPWCYLGARRLTAAIGQFVEAHPDARPTVRFRAYELDPGAPAEPRPMRPVIERKYGPGAFDSMTARLTALGVAEGIEYRFEDTLRVNTFDAHRLLAWAGAIDDGSLERSSIDHDGGSGVQQRLSDALFRAYFTEGRNVAERVTLIEIGRLAGLDPEEAAEVLESGAFAEEVRTDEETARDLDITGVPATVVDGRLLVPGAQEVATFARVLERAAASMR